MGSVPASLQHLREHKARTGESLSLTAFLIACLGKAVDEHKAVQALRKGSKRLVIFDDMDVWTTIEHDAAGRKLVMPHIFRAANRKTFRASLPKSLIGKVIRRELRAGV